MITSVFEIPLNEAPDMDLSNVFTPCTRMMPEFVLNSLCPSHTHIHRHTRTAHGQFLLHLWIQLPIDAVRYGWLRVNSDVSGYVPFTNTDSDSADATNGPYLSIRSVLNGSAESDTVRIVSAKSEVAASKF